MSTVHPFKWHIEQWTVWARRNSQQTVGRWNIESLAWMRVYEPLLRPTLAHARTHGLIPPGHLAALDTTMQHWAQAPFVARAAVLTFYFELSAVVAAGASPAARGVLYELARVAASRGPVKRRLSRSGILDAILTRPKVAELRMLLA